MKNYIIQLLIILCFFLTFIIYLLYIERFTYTGKNYKSTNNSGKYIIIYTIPKSGTHLISDIISLMINKNTNIYSKNEMYNVVAHRPKNLKNLKYNIYFEHVGFVSDKNLSNSKLILIIRNPIDLCISRYYYFEKRKNTKIKIYDYIKDNILKISNDCNKQISLYISHKNSLLIRYEDILLNKPNIINLLYKFIKDDLAIEYIDTDLILKKTNFSKVRSKEEKGEYRVGSIQPYLFHRKGTFGQWKQQLTEKEFINILDNIPENIKSFYQDIFIYNI